MADMDKLVVNDRRSQTTSEYDIKDSAARQELSDVKAELNQVESEIFEETSEVSATASVTYANWRLNENGYRVADNNYKIPQYRVFAGELLKIVADDKFQFQSSSTINASGTTYRVGKTYGPGTYYLTVPTGAVYVTVSTPATDSGAHVYRAQSKVGEFIEAQEEFNDEVRSETANIYNAYTKQVSDIAYTDSAQIISIAYDGDNMKLVAGSGKGIVLPVIGGTTVRVIKPQTPVCLVCFTSEYPQAGVAITHIVNFGGIVNTNIVAESQANDRYACVYVSTSTVAASDVTAYYSQENRGTVELLPQLDSHIVNLLKYRPVGKVSKAYIALSCDDGIEPLATYTLPRIQYWNNYYGKDIPLHMALFDNSPVFANAEYTALIKDMCDNHNCSIGIHGPTPFEQYTPTYLYNFLKKQEQAIIDKTGVTPTSVIYPHSSYNDIIQTICGAWYGICGASGQIAPPYTYSDDHDLPFYVGEKSNCYEVYRLSIKDTQIGNANEAHRVIDYAIANNLIICPYFHDIDFTNYSEATNNFNKAMLDAFIQYGMEQGVEFVNFGDIPTLL